MSDTRSGSQDETAIRKIVEDWVDAVRRRDLPAVLLNHSSDILMFDVPPPFASRGIDAYAKSWGLFFSWARDPTVFDIKEVNITAGAEIAFVTASMRCAGTEDDGRDLDLDFRLTMGLRKIGGHWTIVHEHHSIPAT